MNNNVLKALMLDETGKEIASAIRSIGKPSDEQADKAVKEWLDKHPEATTSVQDHSLTIDKMVIGTLGYVTPEMFGAVGDGITDDTEALQQCINANMNIVLGKNKSYRITDKLILNDNTCFNGNDSELYHPSSAYLTIALRAGNNCTIKNLTIRSANEQFPVTPADHTSLEDSLSSNVIGIATNESSNVNILNVTFVACGYDVNIANKAEGECKNIIIKDCTSIHGNMGIYAQNVTNLHIDNYQFTVNPLVGDGFHAFYICHNCLNVKIVRCYVEENLRGSTMLANHDTKGRGKNIVHVYDSVFKGSAFISLRNNNETYVYNSIINIIDPEGSIFYYYKCSNGKHYIKGCIIEGGKTLLNNNGNDFTAPFIFEDCNIDTISIIKSNGNIQFNRCNIKTHNYSVFQSGVADVQINLYDCFIKIYDYNYAFALYGENQIVNAQKCYFEFINTSGSILHSNKIETSLMTLQDCRFINATKIKETSNTRDGGLIVSNCILNNTVAADIIPL